MNYVFHSSCNYNINKYFFTEDDISNLLSHGYVFDSQQWMNDYYFQLNQEKSIVTECTSIWCKYYNGFYGIHRDNDLPAIISDNQCAWYQYGLLHRDSQPAEINYFNNYIAWYQHGVRHRTDGPAVYNAKYVPMFKYGSIEIWSQYGLRHRLDGPALQHHGCRDYYVNGERCYPHAQYQIKVDDWIKKQKQVEPVPGKDEMIPRPAQIKLHRFYDIITV